MGGVGDHSATYLTGDWSNNSNFFPQQHPTDNLVMDDATLERFYRGEHNMESAADFSGEKLCARCHGMATPEVTMPAEITTPPLPSSSSGSTIDENPASLSCKLLTCKHRNKPFKTKGDFRRHQLLHKPPMFRCPRSDCDRSRRGFHRKDRLISHLERGHLESKKQAKMLACEQDQATNATMLKGAGFERWASI